MTKLWVLSDLHQEFCREPSVAGNPLTAFDPAPHAPADFDAIVLAGDIDVSLENSIRWVADRFLDYGKPVFYVPGNHDFYVDAGDSPATMEEMKTVGEDFAEYMGVNLLLNSDRFLEDGTRIVGCTLWTDFESVGTGHRKSKEALAAGRYGMNDYRRIKRASSADPTKRKRLRPEDTIREHQASRAYLERTLAEQHDGATVVVTHHAPHPQSLDPRFTGLNFCYASNLQLLIEEYKPELWVHGHVHRAVDYTVGSTRIASNPRGYAFEPGEQDNGFDPSLVLEVPEPAPRYRP